MASAAAESAPQRGSSDTVEGTAVYYEGDPVSLTKGSGAWVPVVVANRETRDTETLVVLPSTSSPVEAVPGIWGTGDDQGILCVIGTDEFDTVLEPGTKVAEIHSASIQTRVCQSCGCRDTDAWIDAEEGPKCAGCGTSRVGGPAACRQCNASAEHCCVLGYAGCKDCRPEQKLSLIHI